MSDQSPPFRRRLLGRELRELRDAARLTTTEVCDRLEISPPRLSRIENGQTAPDIVLVKSLLDEYGIPVSDWDPYLTLARDARRKAWWQFHGLPAMGYVALESAADEIRDFALALVPGLLQTEAYATAALRNSLLRRSEQKFADQLVVRMRRQRRLTEPDGGLNLVAIVDEGVLWRPVGGTEVMREQLRHLVEMAALSNVTLLVLPAAVGTHLGMAGAFTLLSFSDKDVADIAHIEHVAGALQLEKDDQVRDCRLTFDRLRSSALAESESVALIQRVAADL